MEDKGTLFVIATPIGNLQDITIRALECLRNVDYIATEDTRHTLKLLNKFNIKKPLISYYYPREKEKLPMLLKLLNEGKKVALITKAGTPCIADPGMILVRKALEEKIEVHPVPGPSAIVSSLSVSGIQADSFIFLGFLPKKAGKRIKLLNDVSKLPYTIVIFEAPERMNKTLEEISSILGNRKITITRELTKIFEEIIHGFVDDIRNSRKNWKGEITIVIEGRKKSTGDTKWGEKGSL